MRKQIMLFTFLIFTSINLNAGKIEIGYEALGRYDYFKAKEIFSQTILKYPVLSCYGLALIYTRTDNPFHDVNSAHAAILISNWSLIHCTEKEKLLMAKLSVSNATILFLKQHIDTLGFNIADKKASSLIWNDYLEVFCGSVLEKKAIENRNEVAYSETKLIGTWQAYKSFSLLYPAAIQFASAMGMYERLLYETSIQVGSISSFEKFIVQHPSSPFCSKAEDEIFNLFVADHTVVEYHNFILKYPKNRNVNSAWKSIYALYTTDGKSTTIAQFWIDYPDFPFKETITEDLQLSMATFYPIQINEKWGFVDEQGKIRIPCEFEWVEFFSEGIAAAGRNDKSGFIGKNGKVAISFNYDEVESFNKGLAQVKINNKVGLIDHTGHLLVPIMYDAISEFFSARAVVIRDGKYGYIDRYGSEVIPCELDMAGDFSNGSAVIAVDSLYGFIDYAGNFLVKCEFSWVESFENGFARVEKNGKFGLISAEGKLVVPCVYSLLSPFKNGFAMIVQNDNCGFIRADGKIIIPCKYEFDKNLEGETFFIGG
ncbi:WG repeat-containing protein, partial [Flavobacterium sp.]|uniref:WG repeat-containing protein n=1 Tax=Flavobacterium sp. TaxID=239 RepID=UPI003BC8C829